MDIAIPCLNIKTKHEVAPCILPALAIFESATATQTQTQAQPLHHHALSWKGPQHINC